MAVLSHVETVYRCKVVYEFNVDDVNDPQAWLDKQDGCLNYLSRWCKKYKCDYTKTGGGPCWDAYVIIEGATLNSVKLVAGMFERKILRNKGARIL